MFPLDQHEKIFRVALEMLDDAEYTFDGGRYKTSINRSYYAVFYASKALLLK